MRQTKTVQKSHSVNPAMHSGLVKVALVGVGGNGCRMLHGLAQLHLGLIAHGHGGLHVTSFDPDIVSQANVGRTVFSISDVGMHKATVLTHRINCAYGLDWESEPSKFDAKPWAYQLLISCVDSAGSRRQIHKNIWSPKQTYIQQPFYWMDLGNSQKSGQVIVGETTQRPGWTIGSSEFVSGKRKPKPPPRLPCVTDLYPELLDAKVPEDNTPSCSLQEAVEHQDLFINAHVSTWALQLLWEMFRNASIDRHGYFINLESGRANPLMVESSLKMCPGVKG